MAFDILKKVNPKEAEFLRDSKIPYRVRFRFGGESFPPIVYFKVFPFLIGFANGPIEWLFIWQIYCISHWLIDILNDWLIDWYINWLIDRINDCSIDWLINRLVDFVYFYFLAWPIHWPIDRSIVALPRECGHIIYHISYSGVPKHGGKGEIGSEHQLFVREAAHSRWHHSRRRRRCDHGKPSLSQTGSHSFTCFDKVLLKEVCILLLALTKSLPNRFAFLYLL